MFTKADSLLGRSLLDFARVIDKELVPLTSAAAIAR
jgi:hypothetical protein